MTASSDDIRLRIGALALVVAPGLTLAADLVQASPSGHDTAAELSSIAGQPGAATLSAGLGFVALVLMVPAYLAMARPLWDRHPRAALAGTSLSIAGVFGLVALLGSAPVTVAMVQGGADRATMVALTDRYEGSVLVGVWVGLMLLGSVVGPLVLGVTLWRSGWSIVVPGALGLGIVLMVADAGRWPLAAGYACTWVGLATVGVGLLRGTGAATALDADRGPVGVA
jgi:hypothetical protein